MRKIQEKFGVRKLKREEIAETIAIEPRATVRVTDTTESSITWKVSGLQYPARDYDKFIIDVEGDDNTFTYETWYSSNSTNSTQYEVTGLRPNVEYKGTITAVYNGKDNICGSAYGTTRGEPVEIRRVDISGITATSFDFDITCDNKDYYDLELYVRGTQNLQAAKYNHKRDYGTFENLEANTEYKLCVSAFASGEKDYVEKFVTTKSLPQVATPNVFFDPSVTSVSMTWTKPRGAKTLKYTMINTNNNTEIKGNFPASSESGEVTGLKPNTEYKVYTYYLPNSDYAESERATDFFTTLSKPSFNWSTPPVAGKKFSISASDWNHLQQVINELRRIDGLSSYSFTKAYSGDPFKASMFNEAVSALSSVSGVSGVPSKVSTGSPCYASDFKAFETAINRL